MPDLTTWVAQALADAATLVFPVECAGCGRWDIMLCGACRATLRPAITRRRLPSGLEVSSALPFDGIPARIVRAMKQDGRTALARALAPALAAAVGAQPGFDAVAAPPTSRAAMRSRGYRVPELLARRAGLHPIPLLRGARTTSDQRRLGRDERARNVAGSMRARPAAGIRILVVDDVVTTGATLEEAARALRAAGAEVVGAATVASTPRRVADGWPLGEFMGDADGGLDYGGSDKATEVRP